MTAEEIITKLGHKGVKATANRILVYRMLEESDRPVSLADMERLNLSMDKSSIFRVLTLFHEHDVVHAFEDGRGILNYELCHSEGACNMNDSHVHFYCESCQRSFCLDNIHIHDIKLPPDFDELIYSRRLMLHMLFGADPSTFARVYTTKDAA